MLGALGLIRFVERGIQVGRSFVELLVEVLDLAAVTLAAGFIERGEVFFQRFGLRDERTLLFLPLRALIGIAIGGQRVVREHLALAHELLTFLRGNFGRVFIGEGLGSARDGIGVRIGDAGGFFEGFEVFGVAFFEGFELRKSLATELRHLFGEKLRFIGIELIWSVFGGVFEIVPKLLGLLFDLLEFALSLRERGVGLRGVFLLLLADLIERLGELARLLRERFGALREAALAFGPLTLTRIDGALENDDAHGG